MERRRHKRSIVDLMDIRGEIIFTTDINILNMSIGGVLIKTLRRMNMGRKYVLKLGRGSSPLTLTGEIVWSSLAEGHKDIHGEIIPVFKAGMNFTGVPGEKTAEIAGFLNEHLSASGAREFTNIYRMSGLRLYSRFNVKDLSGNLAYCHYPFRIKDVSLGGMLMEGADPLEIEDRHMAEMVLPENKVISFLGRVVRRNFNTSNDERRYETGIEFIDIPKEDREILKKFICFN
ncbi:MAG: PilZ domain-containing protein [Nitrospirota bacterium]